MIAFSIAALPADPTMSDALPFLVGFVGVVATLTVLWALTALLAYLPHKPAPAAAPKRRETSASVPQTTPAGDMPPELVAVIAAAVHKSLGHRPYRVVSIRHGETEWSRFGREQIFSSHKIR